MTTKFIPGQRANGLPERNKQLVLDYLEKKEDGSFKYTLVDLVIKYKISNNRIYELINKAGVKRL